MELDDFKSAWASLDRRLEQQHALNLQLFRDTRVNKMQSGLRPLYWGQILQLLFGACFVVLAVKLWSGRPDAAAIIAAGVVVHAYGAACIIGAGVVIGGIKRIDYAAPVLEIQKQLARVRKAYIVSGIATGLTWWFMWLPVLMVLAGLAGVDIFARAPSVIWTGLGIGVAGLLGTFGIYRWTRHSNRPRLSKFMEESITGSSLLKARAVLDEIARFEQD